jgi:hypothetical protein
MTIPAIGNTVHAQDMADNINTNVITAYNNIIVWYSGHSPFYPASDGSGGDGSYSSTSPSPPSLGPSSYSTSTAADYVVGSRITASTLVNAWINYATVMSRVRSVRVVKYYAAGNGGTGAGNFYDQTHPMSLSTAQASISNTSSSYNIGSGKSVSASNLNSFVTNLASQVSASESSTVLYTETWCHSNCHTNYSARGRR